jgi:tetratricopeptide (TPR) repeat protein
MILGRALGLKVGGVYTPDHAFCTVQASGRLVDVETTNRYGFDPGSKTAFHDAFGNTGFTYVPPGNYSLRTATDARGLISFILQNRMSLLERQYRFSEAVGLAVDRYAVLGSKSALNDLASEAGNYCALLNQQGNYTKAIDFVDSVEKDYGRLPELVKLLDGLVHNEVLRLSTTGDYSGALRLIAAKEASGALDHSSVAGLKQMVSERQLTQAIKTQPFSSALSQVETSYRQGDIPASLYNQYLVALYGKEAQATASSQGYLAAAALLEEGIKLTKGDPQLERGRQVYINNYIATVHNRFASLFNNRDYTQAEEVLNAGLKIVPDSSVLNQDLGLLRQSKGN